MGYSDPSGFNMMTQDIHFKKSPKLVHCSGCTAITAAWAVPHFETAPSTESIGVTGTLSAFACFRCHRMTWGRRPLRIASLPKCVSANEATRYCGDAAAFHFHAALPGMLSPTLIRDQGIEVRQSR